MMPLCARKLGKKNPVISLEKFKKSALDSLVMSSGWLGVGEGLSPCAKCSS